MTQKFKKFLLIGRLAVYLLVPAVLLLLPADYFDSGEAVCLSVLLADIECYACGLTRACMHLIHFNFNMAFYYNALSFVVVPLISWLWLTWFIRDWKSLMALRRNLISDASE